jgi:hypothetical protein
MPHLPIHIPPTPAASPLGVLRLRGTEIVGSDGKPILLRGAGIGGHLNMENCKTRPLSFSESKLTLMVTTSRMFLNL